MASIDELIARSVRAETVEFRHKVYKQYLVNQPAAEWYFSWFGEDDLLVKKTGILRDDMVRIFAMGAGAVLKKLDDPLGNIIAECKTLPEDLAQIYETRRPLLERHAAYWKEHHKNPGNPDARLQALCAAFPDPRAAYDHFEEVEGKRQRAALALREVFSKLAGSSSVAAPLCRPLALTPSQIGGAGAAVLAYRRDQIKRAYGS